MRTIFVITASVLLSGFSLCHRESDDFSAHGTITGPDLRDCVCCGGWYIEIDTAVYEFDTLPENSGIDLEKETFPIKVKLDWQLSEKPACPNKRIDIQRIAKEK
jgi:hypothetical protein